MLNATPNPCGIMACSPLPLPRRSPSVISVIVILDLSVSAQRHHFASCAALRLGIPTAQIMDVLGALLPAMKEFTPSPESSSASMETSVGVELSPAARAAAMELVRCEQVLERIVSGVESLSWVGEPDTKALLTPSPA